MSDSIKLIQEDWSKLSSTTKLLILHLVGFLLLTWINGSLKLNFYSQLFVNPIETIIHQIPFVIANIIVCVSFIFSLAQSIYISLRIIYFRMKYPLINLNKTYYIISFKGRYMLIDTDKKEMKWIASWRTAIDLDFGGEYTSKEININSENAQIDTTVTTKNGTQLNLKDYPYKGTIHTQGIRGS